MDHASPWLTPSSRLAATIQPQLGATATSTGTGSATSQPAISSRRRPSRAASAPAPRLVSALRQPERDDEREHRRSRRDPEVGLADQRQRRALEPDHRAHERVDGHQQAELRGVRAQVARARPASPEHAIRGDDLGLALGRRRQVLHDVDRRRVCCARTRRRRGRPARGTRRRGRHAGPRRRSGRATCSRTSTRRRRCRGSGPGGSTSRRSYGPPRHSPRADER